MLHHFWNAGQIAIKAQFFDICSNGSAWKHSGGIDLETLA
jgi:hypothetical protein